MEKGDKGSRPYVDQDGCERVNVSSGTGLPGLSRTNGRNMVVVVVISEITCSAVFGQRL